MFWNQTKYPDKYNFEVDTYKETLPNGAYYIAAYKKSGTLMNSKKFIV
mgnify:CR=1 FL=1